MTPGSNRALTWDGLINGRDLGGLDTAAGPIARGRLVRSASPHTLTADGWQQLVDHGVRTIVDLRHRWEIDESPIADDLLPAGVVRHHVPIEPHGYVEGWSNRVDRWKLSTPHYYREFMAAHADRVGAVLEELAAMPAGGVLIHCQGGKDRAGLVVAALLDLLGADRQTITADHWSSFDRRRSVEAELGKVEAPGKPKPDRAEYARVVGDVLDAHPAVSCFPDLAAADAARERLGVRLCQPGPG